LVFAGVSQRAPAGAAILEVGAVLVHFAEFLAHEADNFHSKHGLSADELEEDGGGNEAECAVSLAMGAEGVRGGAEGCGQSNDATGAEEAFEDFAAVVGDDGDAGEAVLNDVDAAALGALPDDGVVPEGGDRFREGMDSFQKLLREEERTAWL
jgi:hypothetical protein